MPISVCSACTSPLKSGHSHQATCGHMYCVTCWVGCLDYASSLERPVRCSVMGCYQVQSVAEPVILDMYQRVPIDEIIGFAIFAGEFPIFQKVLPETRGRPLLKTLQKLLYEEWKAPHATMISDEDYRKTFRMSLMDGFYHIRILRQGCEEWSNRLTPYEIRSFGY